MNFSNSTTDKTERLKDKNTLADQWESINLSFFLTEDQFYDGRKRRKLKECVSQRRNIDYFFCDTYYEEEDDE